MGRKKDLQARADGRYRCTYQGRCFYGKTRDEARKRREEYVRLVEEGMRTGQVRVRDFANMWLPIAKVKVKPHTYNSYAKMIDYLNMEIGDMNLNQVKPTDIKRVYSNHYATFSGSHIKHAKNLYTGLFDAAVGDGYIRANPCRAVSAKPHKGPDGSHREITEEERYLIETTEHPLRPLVMTMLYAGLRNGEALALDVDRDVDFEKKFIHVRRFRHADSNVPTIDESGKNQFAKRDIKLFPQLEEALKGLHGLLITMHDDMPLSKSGWKRIWGSYVNAIERRMNGCQKRWYGKRQCDKENKRKYDELMAQGKREEADQYYLPPWKPFTVRPYDLRHSFATYCRDNEVDILVCMRWMGHSDSKMILAIYDHVSTKREQKEFRKILKAAEEENGPDPMPPEHDPESDFSGACLTGLKGEIQRVDNLVFIPFGRQRKNG